MRSNERKSLMSDNRAQPAPPVSAQELRFIADSIEEWADTRTQEVGAEQLRKLADWLERIEKEQR